MLFPMTNEFKQAVKNQKSIAVAIPLVEYLVELLTNSHFSQFSPSLIKQIVWTKNWVVIRYLGNGMEFEFFYLNDKPEYNRPVKQFTLNEIKLGLKSMYEECMKPELPKFHKKLEPVYGNTTLVISETSDGEILLNGNIPNRRVIVAMCIVLRESIYKDADVSTSYSSYKGVTSGFGDSTYNSYYLLHFLEFLKDKQYANKENC